MTKTHLLVLVITLLTPLSYSLYAEENIDNTTTPKIVLPEGPLNLLDVARITVINSPQLMLQRLSTVDAATAAERMQSGAFDFYTFLSAGWDNTRTVKYPPPFGQYLGLSPSTPVYDNHDSRFASAGVNKTFRSGISANFTVTVGRDQPLSPAIPPTPPATVVTANKGIVKLALTIPLLQGAGSVSAAAEETAARFTKEASIAALQHYIATTLLTAVNAYWDYKAAVMNLKIQQDSQARVLGWEKDATERVVKQGDAKAQETYKRLESSITRLQGYLTDKKRLVASATDQVNVAKTNLATVMGIPIDQANKLGAPEADFPLDWSKELATFDQKAMLEKWVATALSQRFDLQAVKLAEQSSAALLAKAEKDVLPKLDLKLSTGYNGIQAGTGIDNYTNSLRNNRGGTETGGSLTFMYPIGNNVAQGNLDLRRANHRQNIIKMNELTRGVHLLVGMNSMTLAGKLQEVNQASKSVESYANALQKQQKDTGLLNDPTKIFNLTEVEDKLLAAANNQLTAVKDLAKLVAQIRFETGTLLVPVSGQSLDEAQIKLDDLTSLPR